MAIEIHPFKPFIPEKIEYLLLGSFTSKNATSNTNYDFYYSNGRNHFWPLIEQVYSVALPTKESKIELFTKLKIGITDIIYKCERTKNSSLDTVLKVVEYNPELPKIFESNLKAVFFSSRFVETHFLKNFADLANKYPNTQLIYLPSPSPRYARMSKVEKVKTYKSLLPKN